VIGGGRQHYAIHSPTVLLGSKQISGQGKLTERNYFDIGALVRARRT
jgi:hypothetical protein